MNFFVKILLFLIVLTPNLSAADPCERGEEFRFNNFKGNILGDLPYWYSNHQIDLTPEEFDKLEDTIPKIKIACQKKILLDPKNPKTSITFLNEHQTNPPRADLPRITLSLERLNEITNQELHDFIDCGASSYFPEEMMFLHEFLGAAQINDRFYVKTAPLRKAIQAEWKSYQDFLIVRGQRILEISTQDYAPERTDLNRSLVRTVFLDPRYQQCLAIEGNSISAQAAKKKYCDPLFENLPKAMTTIIASYLKAPIEAALTERDQLIKEMNAITLKQAEINQQPAFIHFRRLWYDYGHEYLTEIIERVNQSVNDNKKLIQVMNGYDDSPYASIFPERGPSLAQQRCPLTIGIAQRSECIRNVLDEMFDLIEAAHQKARINLAKPLRAMARFENNPAVP